MVELAMANTMKNFSNTSTVLLGAVMLFMLGCLQPSDSEKSQTYPCTYEVYSQFDGDAVITACDGLGNVYPYGFVRHGNGISPAATFLYPRQKQFPPKFRIRWRTIQTDLDGTKENSAEYVQELSFPQMEKGSEGDLRFNLSKENEWSLRFVPK
jgi:hypothetical protein